MSYTQEDLDLMVGLLSNALVGDEYYDGCIWDANAIEEKDRRIKIWTSDRVPAWIDLEELAELLLFEWVRQR